MDICRADLTVTVDEINMGFARERDHLGRKLPIWQGCHKLTDSEVFLMNKDEPASLDGRYFGPLPVSGGAALDLDGESMTRFSARLCSPIDSPITVLVAVAFLIAATVFGGPTLAMDVPSAHSNASSSDRVRFGGFILEASVRFSISQIWIRAVLRHESGGIVGSCHKRAPLASCR
jgi:hypothetical protein